MKKKILLVTLLLFIVFLNSSMLIVSLAILRERMAAEREKALAEHYVIVSALIRDIQAVEDRGEDLKMYIRELVQTYARYSQSKKNELVLSEGGEWICRRGDEPPETVPDTLAGQAGHTERIVFQEAVLSEPKLCVYGRFPAPYQDYGLLYRADLGGTLDAWNRMKNMLFTVSAAATFLAALSLLKLLNIVFWPLRKIASASRVIAEGNYHARLEVEGGDEIAVMALQFNRMAQQVESQIRLLQETAEQKQQFVDHFSHELRTPLTAIYGYAEYMQKAAVGEQERIECTQFILSECKRLQNMAYQLLDLAALREIEAAVCPVEELFEKSGRIMQVKARENEITLSFFCKKEKVDGDRELLLVLLNNLIDNALKASPKDGSVRVSAAERGEWLSLEVADQGIGMTKEQISHAKEAFYRADKARSRAAGGAGLGLALCDRIAQLHRGRLEFISAEGEGTVARVMLPISIFTTL